MFGYRARGIGAIDESYPVADVTRFRPVLMVAKGNPKRILTVEDLARPDVKGAAIAGLPRPISARPAARALVTVTASTLATISSSGIGRP